MLGPLEAGFTEDSAHHADTKRPPGKRRLSAPTAAAAGDQRLTAGGARPQPPAPAGENSPPSNGRIQHPGDVRGTKNQSAVIVIPHPCGERETQTLTPNTCKEQGAPGGSTSAACVFRPGASPVSPPAGPQLAPLGHERSLKPCQPPKGRGLEGKGLSSGSREGHSDTFPPF